MKSTEDILDMLIRMSKEMDETLKKASDNVSQRVQVVADETSEIVKKASDSVSKRVQVVADETSEIVKKASDSVSKRVQVVADETSEIVKKASDNVSKRVQVVADETSEIVKKASDGVNKRVQVTNDEFLTELREKRNSDTFQEIYNALNKVQEPEKKFLKALFLKSLLTKNEALFTEVMHRLKLIVISPTLKLFGFDTQKSESILTPSILSYVQKALATESEKDLLSILMNTFQSIPELSHDKSGNTLSMREKKFMLSQLLDETEESKSSSVKSQLTDLSYDALLPSYRPSIGDSSYIRTKITVENYLALIQKQPDISEFIVLTIGFLGAYEVVEKKFLQALSANYLFVRYQNCLIAITEYFEAEIHSNTLGLEEKQLTVILAHSKNLREFDHQKNDTRRFFETRLAQYINGITHSEKTLKIHHSKSHDNLYDDESLKQDTLIAANKILAFFLGENGTVDNPRDMEQKICIFANGYKDTSKFSPEELRFIASVLEKCVVYKGRDRIAREKSTGILERKFETEPNKVGMDIWNTSGGTLRGTSPVFIDAQREPMRNMLVDASQVSKKGEKPTQWFWENNRQYAAYVGSISGHTCNIVGMLAKYMKHNAEDLQLERDINLFLIQIVAVYAKRGYHGMLEVIDVLHDPIVQKIFEQYKIKVDLYQYFSESKESHAFLNYALNDTLIYAQILVAKHHVKLSLSSHKLCFFDERKQDTSVAASSMETDQEVTKTDVDNSLTN